MKICWTENVGRDWSRCLRLSLHAFLVIRLHIRILCRLGPKWPPPRCDRLPGAVSSLIWKIIYHSSIQQSSFWLISERTGWESGERSPRRQPASRSERMCIQMYSGGGSIRHGERFLFEADTFRSTRTSTFSQLAPSVPQCHSTFRPRICAPPSHNRHHVKKPTIY